MSHLVPTFWLRWCATMFGVQRRFACRLWGALDVSAALLYQIGICDPSEAPRDVWQARMRHFRDLLAPSALLEASLKVAPETGKPRCADAVKFEEGVLFMLDARGHWLVF